MNIIDLSEVELALETEQGVLSKQIFFFPVGTPVQEVKDWVQATRNKEKTDYSLHATRVKL